jgi:AhpD family alkylhydroperoxidase
MATVPLIEVEAASPEVRAVFDDIRRTRNTDFINNFWRALANHPPTLKRTWESLKEVMAPGALDPLTKELIYIAVSVTNQCPYCIASHTASAKSKGMTDEMFHELMAVVGMANETNRLAAGYQVEIDERWIELDYGTLDGQPVGEFHLTVAGPDDAVDAFGLWQLDSNPALARLLRDPAAAVAVLAVVDVFQAVEGTVGKGRGRAGLDLSRRYGTGAR